MRPQRDPARALKFTGRGQGGIIDLHASDEIVGDLESKARVVRIDPVPECRPGFASLDRALMRKPVGQRHLLREHAFLAAAGRRAAAVVGSAIAKASMATIT